MGLLDETMEEPVNLEYESPRPKAGHSRFAFASLGLAAANYLFIIAAAFFQITPFESRGNEKETKVAMIAGILGVLLAVRARQKPQYRRILANLGLLLNALAIPCASLFLPYV